MATIHQCPGGPSVIDGGCIDLFTDPHNCGSCGHVCSTGHKICVRGRCG
jgi:hypothetical protein